MKTAELKPELSKLLIHFTMNNYELLRIKEYEIFVYVCYGYDLVWIFLWYSNTALFCTDLEEIGRFVQKPVIVD